MFGKRKVGLGRGQSHYVTCYRQTVRHCSWGFLEQLVLYISCSFLLGIELWTEQASYLKVDFTSTALL